MHNKASFDCKVISMTTKSTTTAFIGGGGTSYIFPTFVTLYSNDHLFHIFIVNHSNSRCSFPCSCDLGRYLHCKVEEKTRLHVDSKGLFLIEMLFCCILKCYKALFAKVDVSDIYVTYDTTGATSDYSTGEDTNGK